MGGRFDGESRKRRSLATTPYFHTWSQQGQPPEMMLAGGQGSYLHTTDGRHILDLGSLSFQASLGHGHPQMVAAIQRQAETLCMAPPNADYSAKRELSEKLLELAPPGFSKVFFTLGGAEANENAMKIARLATGRFKFLSSYRSYHGATMGALALTGDYRRPPLEPTMGNVVHVLPDRIEDLEATMELEGAGTIAAVFMEPIPGANGVYLPRKDYWPRMRAACDKHKSLLVADEVLTGFGRTGRCFGFEHEGVVPDMITVAKALTGGYAPLGAVLVHERVASHFDSKVLYAGLTNYAHPLGCAAGLAALAIYDKEGLYRRAAVLEPVLLGALRRLCKEHPSLVRAARGRGLLAAIDVEGSPAFWQRLRQELTDRAIALHVYPARKLVVLAPPLNIAEAELIEGLESFRAAIGVASQEEGKGQ